MKVPIDPTIQLVAENGLGSVYHDVSFDEWLVDLSRAGVTLYLSSEEFDEHVKLLCEARKEIEGQNKDNPDNK